MNAVEVLDGLIDSLDKLPMPAVAKLVDRLACLGFERKRIPFADIDKPAMERPSTLGVRIIVPLDRKSVV